MVEYTDCFSAEGKTPSPNEFPGYDIKKIDGKAHIILELWGIQNTPSLPLLLCPLWPRVVAPDKVRSIG